MLKFGMKKLALMSLFAVAASMSYAQVAAQKLFLDLKDADIYSAVAALSRQSGLQFVVADRDKEFRLITLSLRDVSPEDAIRHICTAAGGFAHRDESGVYIIRFGEAKAPEVKPIQVVREASFPVRIRPRRADALHILQQILPQGSFDPDAGFRETVNTTFSKRNQNQGTQIFVPTYQGGIVSPTLQSAEQNPGATAPREVNQIWLPGAEARQAGFGAPGQGGGGAGQGFGGNAGQGAGQGAGATTLTPGEGLVPEGIDYISYDPADGSIVVMGTADAVNRLRQLIDFYDIRPIQIEVVVEFITTSQSLSKSFGIDWQLNRGAVFAGVRPGTFTRAGDPVFINYSTGNLVTRLRAQLLQGEGKVVNAPRVRTLNNQIAQVAQQAQTTFFVPTITGSAGGNIVSYTAQNIPITSGLIVRPRAQQEDNGDYYITLSLAPQIQEFGQFRTSPDGLTVVPDTLSQLINVSMWVKDGDTVVLGGLNRTQTSTEINKFPILGDLPILGQFFRRTVQERNDQELLIFVTPRVIKNEATSFAP